MAKKDKDSAEDKKRKAGPHTEAPVDLASRIGGRTPAQPVAPQEEQPAPPEDELAPPQRLDGPLPPRRGERPSFIGMDEPPPARPEPPPPSRRTVPGPGEIDIVVTPLATPDDWHEFEIALRRVRGITQLRPEYYRHGVAKMRVMWEGEGRLAQVLREGIQSFRVRVIGEDKGTLQILVSRDNDDRRPG